MINTIYDEKIRAWLVQHRDRIVEDLMALMRIPSVRGEAAPGAPFGAECARVVEASAQLFADLGFPVRVEAERGYALAQWGEGDKTIGLFGHADVVSPGDGWLYTQPFTPIIKDGVLIGRGCADDKGAVVASACVMAMLRDLGIPLQSRLLAFAGGNEETGMADVQSFVAHEAEPDICLVPDGSFPCSLGEKSKTLLWAQCDTPFAAIRDFRGGIGPTMVLSQVDVVLEPDAALERQLREKIAGSSTYTLATRSDGALHLQVQGVSAHTAYPEGSVNAGALAAELLAQCDALPASDRKTMETVRDLLSSYYGEELGIAYTDERFGRLTCANSIAATENGCLRLNMAAHSGSGRDPAEIEANLQQVWQSHGWHLTELNTRRGFHVDESSPVPGMMQQLCHELTGLDRPLFRMSGGTYSRHLKNGFSMGLSSASLGDVPKLTFPEGHGGLHQPDESMDVDAFLMGIRILTHAVIQCDALLH